MAGPTAMFPTMSFELDDLSGVARLAKLEILVVVNQNIQSFEELSGLSSLHSLFLFSNRLKVLKGVEKLRGLKKLYINDNLITTLQALSNVTGLETLHCANNKITSLKGIGTQHKDLKEFFCLPNEGIWQSEILRFETEVKIRCLKG
jgi:Leucine-rich repeat (LRR) protein